MESKRPKDCRSPSLVWHASHFYSLQSDGNFLCYSLSGWSVSTHTHRPTIPILWAIHIDGYRDVYSCRPPQMFTRRAHREQEKTRKWHGSRNNWTDLCLMRAAACEYFIHWQRIFFSSSFYHDSTQHTLILQKKKRTTRWFMHKMLSFAAAFVVFCLLFRRLSNEHSFSGIFRRHCFSVHNRELKSLWISKRKFKQVKWLFALTLFLCALNAWFGSSIEIVKLRRETVLPFPKSIESTFKVD